MKRSLIISAIFFIVGLSPMLCQNHGLSKNDDNAQNIKVDILRKSEASWVYKITTNEDLDSEIQIRTMDGRILTTDKAMISNNFISKFDVSGVPSRKDFYLVILKNGHEFYIEKLNKS